MKNNTVRALLTVSSCVGVAGTALMAIRDTRKNEKLPEFDGEKDLKLYFKRKALDYLPTILVGGTTIGCIVTNHILTAREVKALTTLSAGAAALLEKYKDAIYEEFGQEGTEKVVRNVANRKFKEVGGVSGTELLVEDGSELYYWDFSDSFFRSSKTKVLNALYEANMEFAENREISISRLEDLLEITPNVKFWDGDYGISFSMLENDPKWLNFDFVEAKAESGEPFTIIYLGREAGIYDIDANTYVELN